MKQLESIAAMLSKYLRFQQFSEAPKAVVHSGIILCTLQEEKSSLHHVKLSTVVLTILTAIQNCLHVWSEKLQKQGFRKAGHVM